jgi:RHS repeat-associated protein
VDYKEDGQTRFLISVNLTYEGRPEPFSEYRSGFEIRTTRRCTRIDVRTHAGEERITRSYRLVYLDQSENAQLPLNGVSLLRQIQVSGEPRDPPQELPPLEFSYTGFAPQQRTFFALSGPGLPTGSLGNDELELVDLFGHGLPDILEMNGTARYWRNRGAGTFDLPRQMREAPADVVLGDAGVRLLDVDGDGRTDLLVSTEGLSGYFPLGFGGMWDRGSFRRQEIAPSFDLKDPEVRMVDLDGDGITDAIRSGTRLECFFNDPQQGWSRTSCVDRLERFPDINFSDPRVQWADMTGDGMQDLVLVYDGNIEYWPNLGYGEWGAPIAMRHSPRYSYGYDPARILLGDVDGDGAADLVYVDHDRVLLWINRTGNEWSHPIEIRGTPPISDTDTVRLADLLGTGVSGLLWSLGPWSQARDRNYFLDFTGGLKPYLLNKMNNHMGALTLIDYAPSTRFYLEDERNPKTRWKAALPFPVHVVSRVEVIDEISESKLSTEYAYHHGYWDGGEREFRGFGRVDQRDTETFADFHAQRDRPFEDVPAHAFSPPVETRTWFHQGPVGEEFGEWKEPDFTGEFWPGDPPVLERSAELTDLLNNLPRRVRRDAIRTLRGQILRTELYALDGTSRSSRPYTVTESVSGIREVEPPAEGTDRQRIFFPHVISQRTTQWERGDEPLTQLSITANYDDYGQPQSQTQIACDRGWSRIEDRLQFPYLATRTVTKYAAPEQGSDVYIRDRVARTTVSEFRDAGPQRADELWLTPDESASLRVIAHTVHFYDGETAFAGLRAGLVGRFGALVRTESLTLTDDVLRQAGIPADSPYFIRNGNLAWTEEYPAAFRDLHLPSGGDPTRPELVMTPLGYGFAEGNLPFVEGWYVAAERRRYDFHSPGAPSRGMLLSSIDPLGHESAIVYDDTYALLPVRVTDPAGLSTSATYDYRFFQPAMVTDPNGNRNRFTFSSLGLLESVAVMGKDTENVGDDARPGTQFEYQLTALHQGAGPVSVRTIRYVHHALDMTIDAAEREETIETFEYSDGFGRLVQTRTQAEDDTFGDPVFGGDMLPADQSVAPGAVAGRRRAPGDPPNVVVSGWQRYNNKGKIVEKYEPFFSTGWAYARPREAQVGQKATLFYDPRGNVVRTVNPDDSVQSVIYGVPSDLSNPEEFRPTAWFAYTYDANDNAGRTHREQSLGYADHSDTPASVEVDALGRTIRSTERNGAQLIETAYIYDVRGNVVRLVDALGRERAFEYFYDLGNRPLRTASIDAGERQLIVDAAGNEVERRDGKGALVLHGYDVLNRPVRLWARDVNDEPVTLREHIVYGDALPPEARAEASNLLGKPYHHYDEAGLLTFSTYDFKGNVLEKVRAVIADTVVLAAFDPAPQNWRVRAFRVDWQPREGATFEDRALELLDPSSYTTSYTYDALNRVRTVLYPQDVEGRRRELRQYFNRAGALERVDLDGANYVDRIAYSAKGQRTLIAYGNRVLTQYAYDRRTFRLARLRTDEYNYDDPLTYTPTGAVLQDFGYTYDCAGNVLGLRDRTPGCCVPLTPDQLDREFIYDPVYRLTQATGRECDVPLPEPWDAGPRCHDPTRTRLYTQRYTYDDAGNLRLLITESGGANIRRVFDVSAESNRLRRVTFANVEYEYTYDPNGNLTRESASRHFEWDHSDRLRVFRTQTGGAQPTMHVHYLYDSAGQRVKKIARAQNASPVESTVYVDGIIEHHHRTDGAGSHQNNTLHIMDDTQRIAMLRVGPAWPGDTARAVTYQLGDHLGSSNVVIDGTGEWIRREEFYPYGETCFGSFYRKRYRFTGKERDEESGLSYHGVRYYAAWLLRWISCEAFVIGGDLNLYRYSCDDPVNLIDPSGEEGRPWYERLLVFVVEDVIVPALGTGEAGTPESATDLPQDEISPHNFMAQVAVLRATAGVGNVVYGKVAAWTGSRVLASRAAGAAAGGLSAPSLLAIEDAARGEFSSPGTYASAIAAGTGGGALLGLPFGTGSAALSPRVRLLRPGTLRFSQSGAGSGVRADTWRILLGSRIRMRAPTIDVVRTPAGLVSIDNTRIAVARELGISRIRARIHDAGELLRGLNRRRFAPARTWGEALAARTSRQRRPRVGPEGTDRPPRMPGPPARPAQRAGVAPSTIEAAAGSAVGLGVSNRSTETP